MPTPTVDGADGRREPSLELVNSALRSVAEHALELDENVRLVVVESTYGPGTTRGSVAELLGSDRIGRSVALGYSPERIDPGNIDFQLDNIPKVTSGFDAPSALLTQLFYAQVLERVVPASSMEAAEATKVLENVFRFINITFAQEFDEYCEQLGISSREVTDLASTKPFGFMPFFAGAGIGGHCIAEDPYFLREAARDSDVPMRMLDAAIANHEARAGVIVDRITVQLGGALEGKRIIVLGVSYKPDIEDARRSPAQGIVSLLESRGATVEYHDPYVPAFAGRTSVEADALESTAYDLAVLLTKHRRFETGPVADAVWPLYDISESIPANPRSPVTAP